MKIIICVLIMQVDPSGPSREALPLPTRPPFTVHLGNLSFDATEGDVLDFFHDCAVDSVRIVEDKLDQKPKGFGYAEFKTVEGLKKALSLSGTQFSGRNIRISVAEPRKIWLPRLIVKLDTDNKHHRERQTGTNQRLQRLV